MPRPPALVRMATRCRAAAAARRGARRCRTAPRACRARITPAWRKSASTPRRSRERGGVRAGGACAGAGSAAPHRHDRLRARDAARDARELARVAERLEVQQHDVGLRVVLPVLEQVVRRDVGLVADRDEARQAEAARVRLLEQREAERAALRRERDAARRERAARERRVQARRGDAMPRQLGPIRRAPCARTSASSSSWRAAPSAPVSAKPAEITHSARTPRAQRRARGVEHLLAGDADHGEVDRARGSRRRA